MGPRKDRYSIVLFNSFTFVIFLAVVLPTYYALSHKWQNRFLLIASYVFYGAWDWRFLSLLAASTIVDYAVSHAIGRSDDDRRRRTLLVLSLAFNLGLLAFFKYFGFFVDSMNDLLAACGIGHLSWALQVVLPVGISFYTFQTMAYTIDVYRRQQVPPRDFIAFALYVSYFPQLVAGPIERAGHLLPAILGKRTVTPERIAAGLQLMLLGYVKKIAIADAVAPYVSEIFANPDGQTSLRLLLGLYLFAVQIYGDFSGYSDIARGVSRLLGIELMVNFRQPYLSANITEFWRRWHISLSSWLRDYLYIPLGGNRKGRRRTYINLMLTMLLGGLWHGAAWTFVIWGFLHAVGRFVTRELERTQFYRERVPTLLKQLWVFIFVTFCWIFFRATSFSEALLIVRRICSAGFGDPRFPLAMLAFCLVIWAYQFLSESRFRRVLERTPVRVGAVSYMILHLLLVSGGSAQPFVYLQF